MPGTVFLVLPCCIPGKIPLKGPSLSYCCLLGNSYSLQPVFAQPFLFAQQPMFARPFLFTQQPVFAWQFLSPGNFCLSGSFYLLSSFSALFVTLSTVYPYFEQLPCGADSPKWSMEMISPCRPVYLCQPKEAPASTASLFTTSEGAPIPYMRHPAPRTVPMTAC